MLSPRAQQSLFTLPAFRGLGEAERQGIAGLFREIVLAKGETLYQAGDEADALYLIVSGAVDVVDGTQAIARYGPGEVFGEAVLVPGERRAVTTRVALDAVLLVLPRGSLDRLLELQPSLHQRVSLLLGRRLKVALLEQDRLGERYQTAIGTSTELGAYARLCAAGEQVTAREAWLIWDTLSMMQQLGAVPEAAPARTT